MAAVENLPQRAIPNTAVEERARLRLLRAHPLAAAFVALSMLFGTTVILLTPPLEGPDEPAHFLRAYAISQGEIVPTTADAQGRRGTFLPANLYAGYKVFERALFKLGKVQGFSYRQVWAEYLRSGTAAEPGNGPPAFALYWGSEGYSPAAYLPAVAGALVARLAGLDFAATLLLMRFAGLAAMTAVMAYAVAIAGPLRWAFLLIGMLPAALYGRSMISADGAGLAYAMLIAALCLKAATWARGRLWERSFVMTLCVMSKPPQLAFLFLEMMTRSFRKLWSRSWASAFVIVPGLILSLVWVIAISADAGTWRIVRGTGLPAEQFSVLWKLGFMWENPLHFPMAMITSLRWSYDYWMQLIGILGWLDTRLQFWVYPVLTAALLATGLFPLGIHGSARWRVAWASGLAVAAYFVAVHLIFFLIWTPIADIEVEGVQGRYFLPALPATAVAVSALSRWTLTPALLNTIALGGGILSGTAMIEALLRVIGLPLAL